MIYKETFKIYVFSTGHRFFYFGKGGEKMQAFPLLAQLREQFWQIAAANQLLHENVTVTGKVLTVEEAIGNPARQDFPLVKGKEKLMQATFKGAAGQAFTDMPGNFSGSLAEIIQRPLQTHFDLAVFVATLNAVLRYLGLIERTVHCKDAEPEECARGLVDFVKQHYGDPRIALVGFQPAFLENLAANFAIRVLDLDTERIGTTQCGVRIEDGEKAMRAVLDWCELIIATGSTLVNGTIGNFLNTGKPVIFYGTTIAGAAYLLGLKRYCACAK